VIHKGLRPLSFWSNRLDEVAKLKGYLRMTVITCRSIQESIAEAKADTRRDTTAVVKQLMTNLAYSVAWGKNLQKKIRESESVIGP
jgi:hypothetical protein